MSDLIVLKDVTHILHSISKCVFFSNTIIKMMSSFQVVTPEVKSDRDIGGIYMINLPTAKKGKKRWI